ncbi:ImmA/IrrE family metallo-endopeptidase [Clostridium sp.]|uniref:ImmA/IrrE family metallo-endopeptidase n=1 Tax=Clostridium sp. TaxID=1506 RepID=UPI00346489A0
MDDLFFIANKNNILIEYHYFPENILGLYYKNDLLPPVIGLNKSLLYNPKLHNCVLGEELGHHFTSSGNHLYKTTYQDKLIIGKDEYKAMAWACNYLISNDILRSLINKGYTEYEICDYFKVTHEFLKYKFYFLRCKEVAI